jgi:hypothetical protein
VTVRGIRLPLFLVMEVLWSFALCAVIAQLFSSGEGRGPSLLAVGAVVVLSFAMSRILSELDIADSTMRMLGVAGTVAALFVILRLEYMRTAPFWDVAWIGTLVQGSDAYTEADAGVFAGSFALIGLWVRGIWRGQITDDFDGALRGAVFGMAPVAIAAASQPAARGFDAFGALAIAFMLLALLVLALYHSAEPDRTVGSLAAQWGTTAIAVIAAAVVLALLAAAVDPDAFGVLSPVGEPLRVAAEFVATWVLGPPLAALVWVVDWIIPDREPPPQQQPDGDTGPERPQRDDDRPWWMTVIQYVLVGAFLSAIVLVSLLLLALLFQRFLRRREKRVERRETLEADRTLGQDLGDLLGELGSRFRRGHRPPPSAVAIRRLYARMLDRAAADGLERQPSTTPLRFAPQLDARYASDTPSRITEAFDASRYGARDIPLADVQDLERRWRALEQ